MVLSRLYNRSIVVYNERSAGREVQEQVFPSADDNERNCTVDKLTNPVSSKTHISKAFKLLFFFFFFSHLLLPDSLGIF